MDRQPLTDRLGDRLLAEYGGAAAAYSLRALNGNGDSVVRVRRASDNDEKDFTAAEVSDGTLVDWVTADSAPSLPAYFPVTLKVKNSSYCLEETGADWLANYSGATLYVSPSGSDITGDGGQSKPYQSLNTAILNAADNDVINLSGGVYAMPTSDVNKDLAFVCPSGKAYIGTFNDLSSAQIDEIDYSGTKLYNVDEVVTGEPFKGWIRTDGNLVGGVSGSASAADGSLAISYQDLGVMSVYAGSSSSNFSTGTSETLNELVDAGSVLAWTDANTDSFRVATATSVYIGENITLASYGTDVVAGVGSAELILDGCEIYGGSNNCVSHPNSGKVLMFNNLVAGSESDNIDYRGTVVAVESNITSNWCGTNTSDNTSTGHASCKVLRVGGTYRGGSRTVHDVNDTKAYVYSCTIGDAISHDKTLLLSGFSSIAGETCTLDYGDITFIDTFNDGGLTNLYIDSESVATLFTFPDGFASTWYDQSGNDNDAVQSVAAGQPKIVDAGSLVSGGLDFDGVDDYLSSDALGASMSGTDVPFSFFHVSKVDVVATQNVLGFGRSTSSTPLLTNIYASGGGFGYQVRDDANILKFDLAISSYSTGTKYLVSSIGSGTTMDFAVNGTLNVDNADINVGAITFDRFTIGALERSSVSNFFNGVVQELIYYPSDQSSNRTAIETNINAHYDIYP